MIKRINYWNIPEYLLLFSVLYYWYLTSHFLNWIAIGLVSILVLQLIFRNKAIGIIIPVVLILACCYMFLALISEFREFPTFNADAKQLLFFGLFYFTTTLVVAGFMFFKYVKLLDKKA